MFYIVHLIKNRNTMFHNNQPLTATVADIGATLNRNKNLEHFQNLVIWL
jgi:hypothetical protein